MDDSSMALLTDFTGICCSPISTTAQKVPVNSSPSNTPPALLIVAPIGITDTRDDAMVNGPNTARLMNAPNSIIAAKINRNAAAVCPLSLSMNREKAGPITSPSAPPNPIPAIRNKSGNHTRISPANRPTTKPEPQAASDSVSTQFTLPVYHVCYECQATNYGFHSISSLGSDLAP